MLPIIMVTEGDGERPLTKWEMLLVAFPLCIVLLCIGLAILWKLMKDAWYVWWTK